jgi:hypothetical protein
MPGWIWLEGAEDLVYSKRCFRGPDVIAEDVKFVRRWWLRGRVGCQFGGDLVRVSSRREGCWEDQEVVIESRDAIKSPSS